MSTEDRIKQLIGSADTEVRASEAEWNEFARRAHGSLYMRRAAGALGAVALIGLGVFAGATLMNDTPPALRPHPPGASPSAAPEATHTEEASPAPAEEGVTVPTSEQELWFVQGEKLSWSTTVSGGGIGADVADDDPIAQRAAFWLKMLASVVPGPVQEDGGTTTIPEGTRVLHVEIKGSTLFVDLSSDFESGGGSMSMQMRVAQVVYTATQFEGIDAARILIEGELVDSIGGEGVMVDRPLTRRDFQGFAPNVVVEQPKPGQEFSAGDIVSGFANVFEANVSFMILDAKGEVILDKEFTTATCGSGCWGDFTKALEFVVDERQPGRVVALTYSAEDGSPQDEISTPVILVP